MADTIKLPPLPPPDLDSGWGRSDTMLIKWQADTARAVLEAAAEAWNEYEDEETRAATFIRALNIEGEA